MLPLLDHPMCLRLLLLIGVEREDVAARPPSRQVQHLNGGPFLTWPQTNHGVLRFVFCRPSKPFRPQRREKEGPKRASFLSSLVSPFRSVFREQRLVASEGLSRTKEKPRLHSGGVCVKAVESTSSHTNLAACPPFTSRRILIHYIRQGESETGAGCLPRFRGDG